MTNKLYFYNKNIMKILIKVVLYFVLCISLSNCVNWGGNRNVDSVQSDNYKPIIVSRTVLENSVIAQTSQNTVLAGKLYIKDNLMFLNEKNKGFHVFNYTDAQNPVKMGFIKVSGATDLAIRNNLLYINQAVDLLTIEYLPVNNSIIIKNRNRNVFPQKKSPTGRTGSTNPEEIVIDWTL